MKIQLVDANLHKLEIIDINTIEDLIKLYHDKDVDLIFSKNLELVLNNKESEYQIMLYDGYIE